MLDGGLVAGSILSHAEVVPPKGRAVARGTRSTWAFPDTLLVSVKGRPLVRAGLSEEGAGTTAVRPTAMIRSIVTEGRYDFLVGAELPHVGRVPLIFGPLYVGRWPSFLDHRRPAASRPDRAPSRPNGAFRTARRRCLRHGAVGCGDGPFRLHARACLGVVRRRRILLRASLELPGLVSNHMAVTRGLRAVPARAAGPIGGGGAIIRPSCGAAT